MPAPVLSLSSLTACSWGGVHDQARSYLCLALRTAKVAARSLTVAETAAAEAPLLDEDAEGGAGLDVLFSAAGAALACSGSVVAAAEGEPSSCCTQSGCEPS